MTIWTCTTQATITELMTARRPTAASALASLPRAGLLGSLPTPVVPSPLAAALWIKRDDLTAPAMGGNKVRALDYLRGGVRPNDEVLTAGAMGSTHSLTTVVHAKALGARTTVVRWPQEMNEVARVVARRIEAEADQTLETPSVLAAYWRALRVRMSRDVRWVPAGGTSALGILGHVDAALELAGQIEAGVLPTPTRIVVPLGSGGTAAGLVLGLAVAGLPTTVIGVRVVSRLVANHGRVMRLAARAARLIERLAPGSRLPPLSRDRLQVAQGHFGGAYARPTTEGRTAADGFRLAHPPSSSRPIPRRHSRPHCPAVMVSRHCIGSRSTRDG